MNSDQKCLCCLLALVIILFALGYRVKCNNKEGLQRRLANPYSVQDNAYASKQFPNYSAPVEFDLEGKREGYANLRDCQTMCTNVPGNTEHADCIQKCVLATAAPGQMNKACHIDADCNSQEICVEPSYYGGSTIGFCMSNNEPGIPRQDIPSMRRENFNYDPNHIPTFGRQSCLPGQFYNEYVDQCQPRFQGPSSARAINDSRSGPPPKVFWPGSITPGYGVGRTDPFNIPAKLDGR